MQPKRLSIVIISTLAVFLMVLCVSNISMAEPKSIRVSGVISMTGPMAGNGIQLHEAYQILTDKINASGGLYIKEYDKKLPIEYRLFDDESKGTNTQTQLEAANSWGAVANLGGLGCGSFELGTPIAQKNKMTWVGPGCGGYTPHTLGNQWLFSVFVKTKQMAPMVFDMIREQPEPRQQVQVLKTHANSLIKFKGGFNPIPTLRLPHVHLPGTQGQPNPSINKNFAVHQFCVKDQSVRLYYTQWP